MTIFGALSDQFSGSANNAAKAALARILNETKAASDANTKQIQQAQDLLPQTQASLGTNSNSSSTSLSGSTTTTPGTVFNSIA